MLKTRIVTALVLLTLFLLVMLFATPSVLNGLIALIIGCAAWEWARLLRLSHVGSIIYACATVAGGGAVHINLAMLPGLGLMKATVVFWISVAPFALARQPALAHGVWRVFLLMTGPVIFLASWDALVYARARGTAFLISLLLVVWLADIGAYFAGTRWGRHKLAPTISPGKTWEGVLGGGLLVVTVAVCAWFSPFASHLAAPTLLADYTDMFGNVGALAAIILLVGFSVVGDLFESLLKRQANVKDSSTLLPGHGGVLDRIDALLPVLPLAIMLMH